jgi:hypothetical protein
MVDWMHAYEMHIRKMHACKIHAYEAHTYEVYTHDSDLSLTAPMSCRTGLYTTVLDDMRWCVMVPPNGSLILILIPQH